MGGQGNRQVALGCWRCLREQQTCPMYRAEGALPAARLLVNGWCSSSPAVVPQLSLPRSQGPSVLPHHGHSHRGAAQNRGHSTLKSPYSCSDVRKGYSSTWWKHYVLQNQGDSTVLDTHPCLSLPKTQDLPSVAPGGNVSRAMAL